MNGWILTDGRYVSSSHTARAVSRPPSLPASVVRAVRLVSPLVHDCFHHSAIRRFMSVATTPKHADAFGIWRRPLFELFKMNMDPAGQCIAQVIIVF